MAEGALGFEDLAVGQHFASASRTVTIEEIIRFATDFDPQPFHTDAFAARDSLFGELVASGWHTAALTMRLLVDGLPFVGGMIGAGGEIRWPKAVKPGDTLSVDTEIVSITPSRSRPDRASVAIHVVTRNQHGETVQTFSPRILVGRRASAA